MKIKEVADRVAKELGVDISKVKIPDDETIDAQRKEIMQIENMVMSMPPKVMTGVIYYMSMGKSWEEAAGEAVGAHNLMMKIQQSDTEESTETIANKGVSISV